MTEQATPPVERWPRLRLEDWAETRDTLHMWTQIVGKIRMAHAPTLNHWWHVTLYVSPRGLTTSAIPHGTGAFELEFDFLDHRLHLRADNGGRDVALEPKPVARFYAETMEALADLGLRTPIRARPNEVDPAIPFAEDYGHASYDPRAAELFWRQLVQADRVIGQFRAGFGGKASPVHFFWGGMDLACTRFSGRGAPPYAGPGVPNCPAWVMREGYSRELASCGFWPGGGAEGAFYAYAYPEPAGYAGSTVGPEQAFYSAEHGEFLLPYEAVADAADPNRVLSEFLDTSYAAAADLGGWDRAALEVDPHRWDHHRVGTAGA
jgi:hypothetical protein